MAPQPGTVTWRLIHQALHIIFQVRSETIHHRGQHVPGRDAGCWKGWFLPSRSPKEQPCWTRFFLRNQLGHDPKKRLEMNQAFSDHFFE